MNNDRILAAAKEVVDDLSPIDKDIYKGVLKFDNKEAGLYYFDLSNSIPEDFDSYQDKIFAKDFYSHPGSIQWNYYLFFLQDKVDPKLKAKLEENDKFARKYVMEEEDFVNFFTDEETNDDIDSGIVGGWKGRLLKANLQDIYGNTPYAEIQRRIDSGKIQSAPLTTPSSASKDVLKIKFINQLILKDSYRVFPDKHRDFTLGKVNLFKGTNGVGKTSLFEAIELMLCGKTLRNLKQAVANGSVEAEFNYSKKLEKYVTGNKNLYQDRDLEWYLSKNKSNDSLTNSFNRFNFFNADAAYHLSSAGSEEEIHDALNNIILGPEFGYIRERCEKFLVTIRSTYNQLDADLKKAREAKETASRTIKTYKEPDALIKATEMIRISAKELNFINDNSENVTLLEGQLNELMAALEPLIHVDFTYLNKKEFDLALAAFNNQLGTFKELEDTIRKQNEKLPELHEQKESIKNRIEKLRQLLSYFDNNIYQELLGLNDRLKSAEHSNLTIRLIKGLLSGIDLNSLVDLEPAQKIIDKAKGEIENDKGKLGKLEQSIDEHLSKLGKIEGLVKQIKGLGSEFLRESHSSNTCPLCQSKFEHKELEERILGVSLYENTDNSTTIADNRLQISILNAEIEKNQKKVDNVTAIVNAYNNLPYDTVPGLDLNVMSENLQSFLKKEEENDKLIRHLKNLDEFAKSSGKSETELRSLQALFELPNDELSDANKEELNKQLAASIATLAQIELDLENTEKERRIKGASLKELLGISSDETITLTKANEYLSRRNAQMGGYNEALNHLATLIHFSEEGTMSEIRTKISTMTNHLNTYRQEVKSQYERDEALKIDRESQHFISNNEEKFKRYEIAFNTLKDMTGNEANEELSKFFKMNFKEIVDIFRSIHTPHEFKDLKYENGELSLIGMDDNVRKITEISTGQRSALALSIFLCLNKKLKDGPSLIMFDDPVAFIDDFNALSFLDYLRKIVLTYNRQLFFATANTRLGSLVEKKFAFLGDKDFKQWNFIR